jgi:formyl-CoA transferase
MTTGRALDGIRVIDVSQVMAGPFCAMQLADMGADVVKVEPPEGDPTRQMGAGEGSDSAGFAALNRGKRAMVLDLKKPAGRDALVRLAGKADILIENFRPGVMQQLGLDYKTLSAANSCLIYASISGYGQTGPDAAKGGFDLVAQGVSGLMSVTGEPGRPPVKCGVPLTDLGAGLFALSAILAALYHRERTTRGQYVDTSLLEAGLALSVWEAAEHFSSGVTPQPLGSAHRFLAPYQAIRCADGHITIGAGTDKLFVALCDLLGQPQWAKMPDFANAALRVQNRNVLTTRIETITLVKPMAHWLDRLNARGIPCGPINTYADALATPQVQARQMVVSIDHPTLGEVKTLGSPIKMSETPPTVGRKVPQLGEHTQEVLKEAGFSEEEIAAVTERQT